MTNPKVVGWAATAVGLGAVASSVTLSSTRVGEGLGVGSGAFIVLFGLLSLAARNRTLTHWGLFVMGARRRLRRRERRLDSMAVGLHRDDSRHGWVPARRLARPRPNGRNRRGNPLPRGSLLQVGTVASLRTGPR